MMADTVASDPSIGYQGIVAMCYFAWALGLRFVAALDGMRLELSPGHGLPD